jgi:sugar lactone lactonase YvrE
MSIEATLVGEYQAEWGEGPIWHNGRLLYVDIEGRRVIHFNPDSGSEQIIEAGERVGTVVPRQSGGLVIAGDNGFSFLDPADGRITRVADPEPDKKPDNRFNDGKCDPAGRFWAGTISTVKKTGDAALYMLDAEKQVHPKYPNVTNSNGLCWTEDTKTFYYIDTPTKKVRAFDFDNATGEIAHERIVIDTSHINSSPDGMAIDTAGNLWIAFCRGSMVMCFDPGTGKDLEKIHLPVSGVTACAFGGPELKTLYITTGQFKNQPEQNAGRLFAAEPGIVGLPSFTYAG